MMFNCHINVEVHSSIKSVKCVFKYVYKGHDKQVVNVDKDREQVVNEIKRFQDARYVSPPEAMWRIYGFPLSNIYPSVMSLQIYLPNKQFVTFEKDVVLTDILENERNKRSMLTAFFELNQTDIEARQHLYKDIPKFYTWNKITRKWNRQKQGKMRGRMLWDDHYKSLSEDYNLNCASAERVQDISMILQSMGRSLSDFDLPNITVDVRSYAFGCREKNAYDAIMRHVDADSPGVFFIDGPGGTGNTFLYKALLATIRSRGLIALATASSGAAANNMTGGRTAHSRFKIPINLTTNSICNIKKQSGLAKLLCQAKLIIWDEASMAKRQAVEAVTPPDGAWTEYVSEGVTSS
ncbi:ATP-dependent DNA helicase PIF1 [Tanacetum coccineum]|uniref:ATP-dependent DNA helicase n=1 Tax=Tanacetum coccineum TaxID=301880 RepID=A0ABQ4Y5G9_9ASTR